MLPVVLLSALTPPMRDGLKAGLYEEAVPPFHQLAGNQALHFLDGPGSTNELTGHSGFLASCTHPHVLFAL